MDNALYLTKKKLEGKKKDLSMIEEALYNACERLQHKEAEKARDLGRKEIRQWKRVQVA